MYNKKYKLVNIEEITKSEGVSKSLKDKVCYLAYFAPGERGWFLCECGDPFDPVHRIHTSEVSKVEYVKRDNFVIEVTTQNTKYIFEEIK